MPRRISVALALVLAFGLVAGAALRAPAAAASLAGVSAAVRGQVLLTAVSDQMQRRIASGEEVYLGDRVETAPRSGMQILLLDESVFTVGPSARLVIDKYVYDPERGTGELAASLVRGALRFVSGRISDRQPENVRLRAGEATIGIRGTIVSALLAEEGLYVFLDGPGQDNDAYERAGLVSVGIGDNRVELTRPGFATLVARGAEAPGRPFRAPPELRDRLTNALGAGRVGEEGVRAAERGGAGGGQGETLPVDDPAETAGQTTVAALETIAFQQVVQTAVNETGLLQPDDPGNPDDGRKPVVDLPPLPGQIATIAQLDSLNLGVASYNGGGLFAQTAQSGLALPVPAVGTAELNLTIDFASRTIGGQGSSLRMTAGTIDHTEPIERIGFDESIGGFGIWVQGPGDPGPVRDGVIVITNGRGVGTEASAFWRYDDGDGNTGAGAVIDAGRRPGANPGFGS